MGQDQQTKTENPPGLVKPWEIENRFGVPQKELWRWVDEGRIIKVDYGGEAYFTTESVQRILATQMPGPPQGQQMPTGIDAERRQYGETRHIHELHREAQRYFDLGSRYYSLGMAALSEVTTLLLTSSLSPARGFGGIFEEAERGGLVERL